jgi:hypothetical protein
VALCQARTSTKPLWGLSSSNPYHPSHVPNSICWLASGKFFTNIENHMNTDYLSSMPLFRTLHSSDFKYLVILH